MVALMLCYVRLSSVCDVCIVAKQDVLEQTGIDGIWGIGWY